MGKRATRLPAPLIKGALRAPLKGTLHAHLKGHYHDPDKDYGDAQDCRQSQNCTKSVARRARFFFHTTKNRQGKRKTIRNGARRARFVFFILPKINNEKERLSEMSPEGRDFFFFILPKMANQKFEKRKTTRNGLRPGDYIYIFVFRFFFPGFRKSGKSGPIYRFTIFNFFSILYSGTWKATSPRLWRWEINPMSEDRDCA